MFETYWSNNDEEKKDKKSDRNLLFSCIGLIALLLIALICSV